jgi:hypothetical protein
MAGTIDFRHDSVNDIVVSRPRWTLTTAVEVMRWYQMHASYFSARFRDRKDLIVINDHFDLAPKAATLWGQYRARLHETYVRYSVRVNNNPRVRLSTNTSAARYSISALECDTVEQAVDAILKARAASGIAAPSMVPRARDTAELGAQAASSRPPPRWSEVPESGVSSPSSIRPSQVHGPVEGRPQGSRESSRPPPKASEG